MLLTNVLHVMVAMRLAIKTSTHLTCKLFSISSKAKERLYFTPPYGREKEPCFDPTTPFSNSKRWLIINVTISMILYIYGIHVLQRICTLFTLSFKWRSRAQWSSTFISQAHLSSTCAKTINPFPFSSLHNQLAYNLATTFNLCLASLVNLLTPLPPWLNWTTAPTRFF